MIDFRGQCIEVDDVVIYVGRQDMKATLVEARVMAAYPAGYPSQGRVLVKPLRSSSPLGQPTGKLVTLTVARKVVVLRKARKKKGRTREQ